MNGTYHDKMTMFRHICMWTFAESFQYTVVIARVCTCTLGYKISISI